MTVGVRGLAIQPAPSRKMGGRKANRFGPSDDR
jgi:hypothetical protein